MTYPAKATNEQLTVAYQELGSVHRVGERFGMCGSSAHERLARLGVIKTKHIHGTVEQRFWPKVDIRGPDECWPWQAGLSNGYGEFATGKVDGKKIVERAHRVAYRLTKGPLPPDKPDVLHTCDNPPCCNPAHLYPGTPLDNMRDMSVGERSFGHRDPVGCAAAGRKGGRQNTWAKGSRNPKAALSEIEVRAIRASWETVKQLAEFYDVHVTTVYRVRRGQSWAPL
jgi:hypothetical protein